MDYLPGGDCGGEMRRGSGYFRALGHNIKAVLRVAFVCIGGQVGQSGFG